MTTLVAYRKGNGKPKNPKDVLGMITSSKIEMVDLKFNDLPGLWQHFSIPD